MASERHPENCCSDSEGWGISSQYIITSLKKEKHKRTQHHHKYSQINLEGQMLRLFECNSVVLKKTAKNTLIFKHKEIWLKVTSSFQNNKDFFSEN